MHIRYAPYSKRESYYRWKLYVQWKHGNRYDSLRGTMKKLQVERLTLFMPDHGAHEHATAKTVASSLPDAKKHRTRRRIRGFGLRLKSSTTTSGTQRTSTTIAWVTRCTSVTTATIRWDITTPEVTKHKRLLSTRKESLQSSECPRSSCMRPTLIGPLLM